MRVVADANVLVSAALSRSPQAPSALTLDAALNGRIELITSPLLLQEVATVLARPRLRKYLSTEEALRFVTDLAAQTTLLVDPPEPHPAVCRDPRDDYLVALARSRGADALVTGDLDLLAIDASQLDIDIVTPASSSSASADGRLHSFFHSASLPNQAQRAPGRYVNTPPRNPVTARKTAALRAENPVADRLLVHLERAGDLGDREELFGLGHRDEA